MDNSDKQQEQKPNIENIFGKLFTTIFQEVSAIATDFKKDTANEFKSESNVEAEPVSNPETQETTDPVIDIPEKEYVEENEANKTSCEVPMFNLAEILTETFGNNCEKLEETMKDLGKNLREAFSIINQLPEIRKFYMEELKTHGTDETNLKTIEKFGLKDTTKFELDLRII